MDLSCMVVRSGPPGRAHHNKKAPAQAHGAKPTRSETMEGILDTPAQVFAVANIRSAVSIRENRRTPITGGLWLR
jgi:hypothetical protein